MKKIILFMLMFVGVSFAQSNDALQTYYDSLPKTLYDSVVVGDTESSGIDLKGNQLYVFKVPSTFDGASVTIETSTDNVTFHSIHNEDNEELSFTVTAGNWYYLPAHKYIWLERYVRFKTDVNVAGTTDIFETKSAKYYKE